MLEQPRAVPCHIMGGSFGNVGVGVGVKGNRWMDPPFGLPRFHTRAHSPPRPRLLPHSSRLQASRQEHAALEIHPAPLLRHVLPRRDAHNLHPARVFQPVQQLGRDQEILTPRRARPLLRPRVPGQRRRGVRPARDRHHALVHQPFVARVHPLVDLVHHPERAARQRLEGHQVEDRRHRPLAAGLPVRVQDRQRFRFAVGTTVSDEQSRTPGKAHGRGGTRLTET